MRRLTAVTLSLVIVALASTPALIAQDAQVRAAIEAADKAWGAALAKGDAAAMAALYTSGAVVYPPNSEPVKGRAAIQKIFQQDLINAGIKVATLSTVEVEAHGDTAIETGTYELKLDGGKVADRGKYIVIWKREQGQWKLHRDIWNSSTPMK